jgi:hypothetical protein
MIRPLACVVAALALVAAAGAQMMGEPHGNQAQSFSGWLYEGAHWLNEGGANDAMFRGADSLYGVNDTLFTVFSGRDRHRRDYTRHWLEEPAQGFYPQTFVYPVAPVTGPLAPLTVVTVMALPPDTVAELRIYLNGVEQTLTLSSEMELQDAPVGGFRYGLHMIVRKLGTGQVVQILSGVGVVTMEPDRHRVELVQEGERLLLR